MKSPTSSILHSIQALKTKLRSDHLQLQGIRRDFAMGPTKAIIQCPGKQESPLHMPNRSLEKNTRAKILQLRKSHRNEINDLKQLHKKQKQNLIADYESKIQQMTTMLEQKIKEQDSYILILQEQLQEDPRTGNKNDVCDKETSCQVRSISIGYYGQVYQVQVVGESGFTFDNKINYELFQKSQKEPQKQEVNKYEKIVNKLLHENAVLLENVQTLKMQYRKLAHHSKIQQNQLQNSISSQYLSAMPLTLTQQQQQQGMNESSYRSAGVANKNRLKFSKASERVKTHTDRSYASIGNQNINTSNIQIRQGQSIQKLSEAGSRVESSIMEEDEESILCEEMKLKTIKHFMKAASHRSTECEDYSEGTVLVPVVEVRRPGPRQPGKRVSLF